MTDFRILAHWDHDAAVWWAESEDINGLVAEAETLERLMDDLKQIVPELLQMNHGLSGQDANIILVADRAEALHLPA